MPHLEGREVGGCKLIRKIGSGGMGDVYLGEQIRVGNRSVAVKVVSPEDMTFHPEIASDIARRFEREAAILGNLSHPNILPVHDSGVQDGMLYLVMEYAPDGSLADALRGGGKHPLTLPLPIPFALDIINQVAAALSYTHQHGIVHRDVKPGNVLIRVEPNGHWHVLLADFGVARSTEVDSQRTQVTGTFIYMAPEQFSAKFSPASDQYALAVMTFQLLCGRPPFDGDLAALTRAHMYEPPPSLHSINPRVPIAVDAVLNRALAKDPARRYPSVAEFAAALYSAAGIGEETTEPGGTTEVAPVKTPALTGAATPSASSVMRADKQSSPKRWLATGALGLLLIALLFGGEQYLSHHTAKTGSTSTATATVTAASATATATATATTGPSPTAATNSLPTLATCPSTTTLSVTDDATCLPSPPASVQGKVAVDDPWPGCDPSTTAWMKYDNTTTKCSTTDGTELTATAANQLGCLEAQSAIVADGYASAFVTQGSGSPVLVFRQGTSASAGTSVVSSTGYFFEVSAQNDTYNFYRIDASGTPTTIQTATIPGKLAQHYVMSVLYTANMFTFYINGVQIGSQPDTAAPAIDSGWYGLCVLAGTDGFRSAQNQNQNQ